MGSEKKNSLSAYQKHATPRPVRIALFLVIAAAVVLGLTTIALLVGLAHAAPVETVTRSRVVGIGYFAFFTIVNGFLAWKLRSRKVWVRNTVVVLYTLSVVLDAYRVLIGAGDASTLLAIILAAGVIVLLTQPVSSQQFFTPQ